MKEKIILKTLVFEGGLQLEPVALDIFAGTAKSTTEEKSHVDLIIEILDQREILYVFRYQTWFQNFLRKHSDEGFTFQNNKKQRHTRIEFPANYDLITKTKKFCTENNITLDIQGSHG